MSQNKMCHRSQAELADLSTRLEASEKLSSEEEARAEALEGDLDRQEAAVEAQSKTILTLHQARHCFCGRWSA